VRFAIVDITGVITVDTHAADALLRIAKAVRLLGAEVVLTGIQARTAQTLVSLGVDLDGLITRSTLQEAIAWALESGAAKHLSTRPAR
jgi:anti-anti-sigma regulatory factor